MLNKSLKIIHWVLYGLVILSILSVAIVLVKKGVVDPETETIFRYSVVALAFYIGILWLIKKDWVYFPWQHDKNKEKQD
tara:strand:- start:241 stop:477 length:237 start_codon:yes stop_codon:yes gene_type:complete